MSQPQDKRFVLESRVDSLVAAKLRDPISTTRLELQPVVASAASNALANDATVKTAAAAAASTAVTSDIAGRSMLLSTDPRVPDSSSPDSFEVSDSQGFTSFSANADGSVNLGSVKVVESSDSFDITDQDDNLAFQVRSDGKTFIGSPVFGNGNGLTVNRVVLNIMAGQSNGEGRARPYNLDLDPQDSRIDMWDWATSTIKTATVPLSSQQQQVGLSIATVIARETVRNEPPGTQVVVFNAAAGGSGMVSTPAQGTWAIDYAGANPRLYSIMMAKLALIIPAISAKYGVAPIIRFYWHQGEADSDAAAYATAFDAMISAIRTTLNVPTMPVILGGIVPEYVGGIPRATLIQTPSRLVNASYAPGIPNGGGSANVGDIVHYHRAGVERLGGDMYVATKRAIANTATSVPYPPLDVSATFIQGTLTAKWSIPICRVTDYLVEYSLDGGAWTTVTGRTAPIDNNVTVSGLIGTVARVRISTVNPVGTSASTTPITALGV